MGRRFFCVSRLRFAAVVIVSLQSLYPAATAFFDNRFNNEADLQVARESK
jgi:hypothetical protein